MPRVGRAAGGPDRTSDAAGATGGRRAERTFPNGGGSPGPRPAPRGRPTLRRRRSDAGSSLGARASRPGTATHPVHEHWASTDGHAAQATPAAPAAPRNPAFPSLCAPWPKGASGTHAAGRRRRVTGCLATSSRSWPTTLPPTASMRCAGCARRTPPAIWHWSSASWPRRYADAGLAGGADAAASSLARRACRPAGPARRGAGAGPARRAGPDAADPRGEDGGQPRTGRRGARGIARHRERRAIRMSCFFLTPPPSSVAIPRRPRSQGENWG